MAQREKYMEARRLRKEGLSYNDIKDRLNVGKGTLSVWLRDMPLSTERINALRAKSPRRIERYRNTMKAKRDNRLSQVYKKVGID